MRVSLNGVYITSYTGDVAEYLADFCDPNEAAAFDGLGTHDLYHLPIPALWLPPSVSPNVLSWPSGASRFATFWMIVEEVDAAALRTAGFSTAGPVALNLVVTPETVNGMNDCEAITASMYMLPMRRLATITDADGDGHQLWLLPLVDKRYFWWNKSADIEITAGTTTWANIFTSLGTALGVTLTTPSIPADYGTPSERFTAYRQPLPLYLDALCYTLGFRLSLLLDGTVSIQDYAAANTVQDAQIALLSSRPQIAGGTFLPADVNRSVPSSVTVVFPKTDDGVQQDSPYTKNVTLASLALSEYSGVTGYSGSKNIIGDTIATYVAGIGPDNSAALDSYADQAATDWYKWQLMDGDYHLASLINWVPNGQVDLIEWTITKGRATTRISWDEYNDWLLGRFNKCCSPEVADTTLAVVEMVCPTFTSIDIPMFDASDEDPDYLSVLSGNPGGTAFVSRPLTDVLTDLGGITGSYGEP